MPHAKLNGIELHYEEEGQGEPIILVTGLAGNTGFWSRVVPMLSDRYHVISVDNRGSGTTVYDGSFTIHDMSEDIAELVKYLDLGPVHILGWSMGSHISLNYASNHPEMTRSLALISSYLKRPSRSSYILNYLARGYSDGVIQEEIIGKVMNVLLRSEGFFRSAEDNGREIRAPRMDNRTGMMDQMASVEGYDARSDAESVSVPVLSVHGLDDIMVLPECGDELASVIKDCRVLRVPDEGHIMRPESYVPSYLEFLSNIS